MSARKAMRIACGLLVVVAVAACTASPAASHGTAPHRGVGPSPAGSHAGGTRASRLRPVTPADLTRCPKTATSHPTALPGASPAALGPGTTIYGNGKLFVTLSTNGLIVAPAGYVNPDGSIGWKFPWWRYVSGQLTITGHRLDAPAPPLNSDVPAGYGETGFQASGVTFPSEGCWQVTAEVDHHTTLTFVTFVVDEVHSRLISSPG
jgi:hypothetical protein